MHGGGFTVGRGRKRKRGPVIVLVPLAILVFFVQSCTSSGGGIGGTGIIVQGIMTKGSIIVHDIRFDESKADIVEDDKSVSEDALQDGMKVTIRGEVNDDGITGVAFAVEAEDEVQGRVSLVDAAADPPFFQVLKQTVYMDDVTIFSDFPGADPDGVDDVAVDQFVEVHGLRDAQGNIRATRVELQADVLDPDPPEGVELKGFISGLGASTFFIGLQEVDFSGATIEPAGASIGDGDPVEVEGSLSGVVLIASRVEREDLEDREFEPDEGEKLEIEGYVSDFTAHPGDFKVDGRQVRTSSSTEFENGSDTDLKNDVEIEVEGIVSGNVLLVDEVTFKRARVKINASATASVAEESVELLGLVVQINLLTEGVTSPSVGMYYKVEGYQDSSGRIIAESIESGETDKYILQAKVVDKDDAADTVTLLDTPYSILVSLNSGMDFEDDNENPVAGVEAFMALITVGKSIIKVQDDLPLGSWDEAELED
jgi:hypothetical protein